MDTIIAYRRRYQERLTCKGCYDWAIRHGMDELYVGLTEADLRSRKDVPICNTCGSGLLFPQIKLIITLTEFKVALLQENGSSDWHTFSELKGLQAQVASYKASYPKASILPTIWDNSILHL